ncbi:hypothetical protein U728_756 [Clostridium botulinum 202F]|nr:hypothetical protein U728_756 [Clostridium botulinum 202F]KON14717.1 hypothetical protein ACP50_00780 [Clostridium botulinum]MBY6988456.1 hypothetical protein [Clostridium botulinum]NFH01691.1 hypothetical protein [Clostridium botulinum]NFP41031.1 hypothetical protein [Clostridium botulinum]
MVHVGTKLVNKVNGLTATVKDITRNGVYILSAEAVYVGFANTCEKPFMKTEKKEVDINLLNKYIKDGTWQIKQ